MDKKELLIAEMTIGDGCIQRKSFELTHCEKQYEYLIWKRNILLANDIDCGKVRQKNNNGFVAYKFTTKSYDWIADLRKEIYTPIKTYDLDILKEFDALGLAIWYFDDGCLSQKKKNGKIHANDLILNTGLQKEENQVYIDYFKEYWDIHFTQVKDHNCYKLRCGTKEARKYIDIIKDHIVPCMSYKTTIKPSQVLS